ncbi:MAG TPA: hypothetical protein VGM27_30615 [Acidobacteriaceae bacterium]|jgi:hypothetical protein
MLLVFLRTVMAAGERQDQRVISLKFAELPQSARVIGQLIVGESVPRNDVRTHVHSFNEVGK